MLDIPTKRCERKDVSYLNDNEADALLDAPDRDSWTGRRDHALLDLAVETGLRVSELTGLRLGDVSSARAPTSVASAKGASTGAHPYPKEPPPCCGHGSKRMAAPRTTRSSQPGAARRSPEAPSDV